MASPPYQKDLLAIAYMVDASLTVASEWHRLLQDEVHPLLTRLSGEIHPGCDIQMAYVAYGPMDRPDGPIVCKRFFGAPLALSRSMSKRSNELGIGSVSGMGELGLAVLEAYASVLEMFDLLKNEADYRPLRSQESPKTYANRHLYLIHIAASKPDSSPHPQYNESVDLDELSWDTLPAEIKQRGIHTCMYLLRPVTRLNELFNAVCIGTRSTPWFNVPTGQSVLLYGFPPPRSKPPAKRAVESTERSSPLKRPRNDASSPVSPAKVSSNNSPSLPAAAARTPKQSPALPAPSGEYAEEATRRAPPPVDPPNRVTSTPRPASAVAGPSTVNQGPPQPVFTGPSIIKYNELEAHPRFSTVIQQYPKLTGLINVIRDFDSKLREAKMKLDLSKQTAAASVVNEQQEFLRKRFTFMRHVYALIKQLLETGGVSPDLDKLLAQPVVGGPRPAPPQNSAQAGPSNTQQLSQANLALGPGSTPQLQGNMVPAMASQLQKLVERKGIQPPLQNQRPPSQSQPQPQPQPTPQPQTQVNPTPPTTTPVQGTNPTWSGELVWNVKHPVPVDIRIEVHAIYQAGDNPETSTWPHTIPFTMIPMAQLGQKELRDWLLRLKQRNIWVSVCRFAPAPTANQITAKDNAINLQRLLGSLGEQKCLAVTRWNIPGKGIIPTGIFMRFAEGPPERQLIGIVFPKTGVPEMPPSAQLAQPRAAPPVTSSQLPPAFLQTLVQQSGATPQQLASLSDQQKKVFLLRLIQNHTQKQQQQQNQLQQHVPQQQQLSSQQLAPVHGMAGMSQQPSAAMGMMAGMGHGNPGGPSAFTPTTASTRDSAAMRKLYQQQLQQYEQQRLLNAMGHPGGVFPSEPPTGPFAGLTASGFAGMSTAQAPGMGVGALGGLPQARGIGNPSGLSANQLQSWMQRHNGDGVGR